MATLTYIAVRAMLARFDPGYDRTSTTQLNTNLQHTVTRRMSMADKHTTRPPQTYPMTGSRMAKTRPMYADVGSISPVAVESNSYADTDRTRSGFDSGFRRYLYGGGNSCSGSSIGNSVSVLLRRLSQVMVLSQSEIDCCASCFLPSKNLPMQSLIIRQSSTSTTYTCAYRC